MKVLEMFETHYSLANKKMEYIVKSKGTGFVYYHGNGQHYRPEIEKMDVKRWFIDREKLIIIVDRDEALEEKIKAFFLINKKNDDKTRF